MLVRFKPGPSTFRKFTMYHPDMEEDVDVSDIVLPYLGPNHDFHGVQYRPSDFEIDGALTIHYIDGRTKTFDPNDVIVL